MQLMEAVVYVWAVRLVLYATSIARGACGVEVLYTNQQYVLVPWLVLGLAVEEHSPVVSEMVG